MQNEVIEKIDTLLKMSESSTNISTLKVELRELECDIKEKKLELKELESTINDDKYFDASGEIVDKNLEISLIKKIKSLKKSLIEIDEQLNKISTEEEKAHTNIEVLEKGIKTSEEYINVLKVKIEKGNNSTTFKPLLKEEETKLKLDKKYLDKEQKSYEKIQNKISLLAYSKDELSKKIQSEVEKLEDVKSNLLNKRSYINSELKKEDQEKKEILTNEIKELETRKNVLLSDAAYIADAAKNYLLEDDNTSALNKVKELRDIVIELPYMNIDDYSGHETLEIELENAIAKRDEFASMINSKNYESVDATLINDRIAYNTDKKERYQKIIAILKSKINDNDTVLLPDLNNRISYCENEIASLREKLEEYSNTLANTTQSNKMSSLQASYDKKQEELNNIIGLLDQYKLDRQNVVIDSYEIETVQINKYEELIKKIDEEIKNLEKQCLSANKVKDIIEIENDKNTLKELNDVVKSIKKRQTFKSTPNAIYDEIEIILGVDKNEVLEEEISEPTEELNISFSDLLDQKAEEISTLDEQEEVFDDNVVEIDDLQEINLDEISSDNTLDEAIDLDDKLSSLDELNLLDEEETDDIIDIDALPVLDEDEEKIKVIDIENLDGVEEPNEFLIGDYKSEV